MKPVVSAASVAAALCLVSWGVGCGGLDSSDLTSPGVGDVSGLVVDATFAEPVIGATVSIDGKSDATDLAGAFKVGGVTTGQQFLTARAGGYDLLERTIEVAAGPNPLGSLALALAASPCTPAETGLTECVGNLLTMCDGSAWVVEENCSERTPAAVCEGPEGQAACQP